MINVCKANILNLNCKIEFNWNVNQMITLNSSVFFSSFRWKFTSTILQILTRLTNRTDFFNRIRCTRKRQQSQINSHRTRERPTATLAHVLLSRKTVQHWVKEVEWKKRACYTLAYDSKQVQHFECTHICVVQLFLKLSLPHGPAHQKLHFHENK